MALLVARDNITVETLDVYDPIVDEAIGVLMHERLDSSFPPSRNEELAREIMASPYHDQLLARFNNQVVGAATLSITLGRGFGRRTQLEDFVTRNNVTKGIGTNMVEAMKLWTRERGMSKIYLQTEKGDRPDAVSFYDRTGAHLLTDSLTYEYYVGADK